MPPPRLPPAPLDSPLEPPRLPAVLVLVLLRPPCVSVSVDEDCPPDSAVVVEAPVRPPAVVLSLPPASELPPRLGVADEVLLPPEFEPPLVSLVLLPPVLVPPLELLDDVALVPPRESDDVELVAFAELPPLELLVPPVRASVEWLVELPPSPLVSPRDMVWPQPKQLAAANSET